MGKKCVKLSFGRIMGMTVYKFIPVQPGETTSHRGYRG